jgi:hypothetical protein
VVVGKYTTAGVRLTVSTGFRHATVFTRSMFIEHDPQMPSRHDRRYASVES